MSIAEERIVFINDADRTSLAYANNMATNGRLFCGMSFLANMLLAVLNWGHFSGIGKGFAVAAAMAMAAVGLSVFADIMQRAAPEYFRYLAYACYLVATISAALFFVLVLGS